MSLVQKLLEDSMPTVRASKISSSNHATVFGSSHNHGCSTPFKRTDFPFFSFLLSQRKAKKKKPLPLYIMVAILSTIQRNIPYVYLFQWGSKFNFTREFFLTFSFGTWPIGLTIALSIVLVFLFDNIII